MKCILSIRYIRMLSSPSMRREWIEIKLLPPEVAQSKVSLHAEGVD